MPVTIPERLKDLLTREKKESPLGRKCAVISKALSFFDMGPSQSEVKVLKPRCGRRKF